MKENEFNINLNDKEIGQDKCPKCGSTDIQQNPNTGKLRCNFCRHEFELETVNAGFDNTLNETIISSGAEDIQDVESTVTLKCESCGAEVVVDTEVSTQSKCHWCRNTLSINNQIPNGAVPDYVLPFKISKEDAKKQIESFVGSRRFFAHPTFVREFDINTMYGVYLPYMIVDINGHMTLKGYGEKEIRRYTVGNDEHQTMVYDADRYYVEREFDIFIDDLTIESNSDKLNMANTNKTNNIINSLMPFDTDNCVKYNSNFIRGFQSERRDLNVDTLSNTVKMQASDIAKFSANRTLREYNRGVSWKEKKLEIKGEAWQTAYLPIWLYSYQEKRGKKDTLHYVAVNARTLETMGSIPINTLKLVSISAIIEIISIIIGFFVTLFNTDSDSNPFLFFLLPGIIYYIFMYLRYRNSNARHVYEYETKNEVSNMRMVDKFTERRVKQRESRISGANNETLDGSFSGGNFINDVLSSGMNIGGFKDDFSDFDL